MKSIAYQIEVNVIGDGRGSLVPIESGVGVPFDIRRIFYVYGTAEGVERGLHAHHASKQVLICVSGSCEVVCESVDETTTFQLDEPHKALYLEGVVWHKMINFSAGAVLLVLADQHYDESDYIRNYQEFKRLINDL